MSHVKGLRVIIAGGASGVGAVVAELLGRRGAKVVVGDINLDGARATAESIVKGGGEAVPLVVDFADEKPVKSFVEEGTKVFGGLDGLVNMGADLRPETIGCDVEISQMNIEVWRQTIEVNLFGYALSTKHAIPHILKNANGGVSIFNVSSMAAFVGEGIRPAYAASKAGVQALTRHTATAWGKHGIRANTVAFGVVESQNTSRPEVKAAFAHVLEPLPLQCMGTKEMAEAVLYLLSAGSSYITGQVLAVNGGWQYLG